MKNIIIKKVINLEIGDCFILNDSICKVLNKEVIDMEELCVSSPIRFHIKFKLKTLKSPTIKEGAKSISHTTIKNEKEVLVIRSKNT